MRRPHRRGGPLLRPPPKPFPPPSRVKRYQCEIFLFHFFVECFDNSPHLRCTPAFLLSHKRRAEVNIGVFFMEQHRSHFTGKFDVHCCSAHPPFPTHTTRGGNIY